MAMTERQWLTWIDPEKMLRGLKPAPSERKLRLFALACCRRINHFITDPASQAALTFVEQHIETTPTRKKGRPAIEEAARDAYAEAYANVTARHQGQSAALVASNAADAALYTLHKDPLHGAIYTAAWAANAVAWTDQIAQGNLDGNNFRPAMRIPEERHQVELLRDIVGNPFRPSTVDPLWLHWNNGTIRNVAQAIYDELAFDRLGVLADALEDAGCVDDSVLSHCRSAGPHVRGCWVVDLLLGKA
jgi:hypothetical protein